MSLLASFMSIGLTIVSDNSRFGLFFGKGALQLLVCLF